MGKILFLMYLWLPFQYLQTAPRLSLRLLLARLNKLNSQPSPQKPCASTPHHLGSPLLGPFQFLNLEVCLGGPRYWQTSSDASSGADGCLLPVQEGLTGWLLSSHSLPNSGSNLKSWSCSLVATICKLPACIPLWVLLYCCSSVVLVKVIALARAKSCDPWNLTTIYVPLFQHTIRLPPRRCTLGKLTAILIVSLLFLHVLFEVIVVIGKL